MRCRLGLVAWSSDAQPAPSSRADLMALRTFADGQIFGTRTGTGPVRVLALHGWGRSHRDFDAVLDGLDAIALDLPGFGATPAPDEPGGAGAYAASVEPVLDECRTPIVVVGHSFGGRIAVHLAQKRPGAVGGLVLTGAPLLHRTQRRGKPKVRYRIGRRLHGLGLLGDRQLEGLKDKFGSADYRAATGVMRDVLVQTVNESYEEQLVAISAPVELVWGDNDDAAPPEIAVRSETLLANAQLTVVPHVGHFLPLDSPAQLRAAIDRRLEVIA